MANLNSELAHYFADFNATFGAATQPLSLAQRRFRINAGAGWLKQPYPQGMLVQDFVAQLAGRNLAIRLYRPADAGSGLIVYYHGGGFAIGSIHSHDDACAQLAQESGVCVASVDYRLTPEHTFPAPAQDAADALAWCVQHAAELKIDQNKIAVGGDSAGAYLALCAALHARENNIALQFMLLIYPMIEPAYHLPSYQEFEHGPGLTKADIEFFWQASGVDFETIKTAHYPAKIPNLKGLPPNYYVLAEIDPLFSEGQAFAKRLQADGVKVQLEIEHGLTHGFLRTASRVPAAAQAISKMARALQQSLS